MVCYNLRFKPPHKSLIGFYERQQFVSCFSAMTVAHYLGLCHGFHTLMSSNTGKQTSSMYTLAVCNLDWFYI